MNKSLLIVGAAGAAAYYAYTQGWLSSILGGGALGIDTKILSADSQTKFYNAGRAKGLTDAQIKALAAEVPGNFAACKSPGIWSSDTATCGFPVSTGAVTVQTGVPATTIQPTQAQIAPVPVPLSIDPISVSTNPGDGGPTGRAMVAANGGNSTADFDTWSYFYQIPNPGAISAGLMAGIIRYGGGDRSKKVTAGQWLSYLGAAQAAGMSGLAGLGAYGPAGVFIPASMIHHRGYGR